MKKVLIIEDDRLCRQSLVNLMQRAGWETFDAEDGDKGIELCMEHKPNIVLCDLLMPNTNGFQVCRAIRKNPELDQTKIIIITGGDYSTDKAIAFEAGANDYIVKPIDFSKLLTHINLLKIGDKEIIPLEGNRFKFWGVRGSIPTPGQSTVHYGGNTSCIEVRADGEIIILDAGTGIRPLGQNLAREFDGNPMSLTLLVSHTHWDHIQGFPFFLPAYKARNRVRILGYEGARESLSATLAGQMESPYFPIALKEMPANIEIEELKEHDFSVGNVRVKSSFLNHPGLCAGYRLYTSTGSLCYLPDTEPCCKTDGKMQMDVKLVEFVFNSDILIMDAQYDSEEYSQHPGWGHGSVEDVVNFAISSQVKKLYLFHHDPSHSDQFVFEMLERAREIVMERNSDLIVEAAREGEEIAIG